MVCPIMKERVLLLQAIIAVLQWVFQNLLTLRTSHISHHHGRVRIQVSDKNLIRYTTEMIL